MDSDEPSPNPLLSQSYQHQHVYAVVQTQPVSFWRSKYFKIYAISFFFCCVIAASVTLSLKLVKHKSESSTLDIHIVLEGSPLMWTAHVNEQLALLDPDQKIHFIEPDPNARPHITLYLTDFWASDIDDVQSVVALLSRQFRRCNLTMSDQVTVSGQYAMWEVINNDCLQNMSNAVVLSAYEFRNLQQTIPDWVKDIANATERQEKIDYFNQYGSPNVFTQFDPHITVGWSQNATAMTEILSGIDIPKALTMTVVSVGVGNGGPYGTVLLNGEVDFPVGLPDSP